MRSRRSLVSLAGVVEKEEKDPDLSCYQESLIPTSLNELFVFFFFYCARY